ncbi:MAG: hypothetical protein PUB69_03920 [Desulfovibrionaceae bacterium]|nr:hypothetical protein [Desulfovibrionaceae bacterium]
MSCIPFDFSVGIALGSLVVSFCWSAWMLLRHASPRRLKRRNDHA